MRAVLSKSIEVNYNQYGGRKIVQERRVSSAFNIIRFNAIFKDIQIYVYISIAFDILISTSATSC